MNTFGEHFGALIKEKRGFEGLTQQKLAVLAFGDESYKTRISELENGKVSRPHQKTIDALVVALNLTSEELAELRKLAQSDDYETQQVPPDTESAKENAVSKAQASRWSNSMVLGVLCVTVLLFGLAIVSLRASDKTTAKESVALGELQIADDAGNPIAVKEAKIHMSECEDGKILGCVRLGYLYQHGIGVTKDTVKAKHLYQFSCSNGNATGCNNLGVILEKEEDQPGRIAESARLFRVACEGGNARGCTNLGRRHLSGQGVAKNVPEAVRLFDKACSMGGREGCTDLGNLHVQGMGVEQNATKASNLYKLSCDRRYGDGCSRLGELYEKGLGVPMDIDQAAHFYRMGCGFENSLGCRNLRLLQNRLPEAD